MRTQWMQETSDAFMPPHIRDVLRVYIAGDDKPTTTPYVTGWSLFHWAIGIIFGIIFPHASWVAALTVHTLWELFQLIIGDTPNTLRGGVDLLTDTFFFATGFAMVRYGQSKAQADIVSPGWQTA